MRTRKFESFKPLKIYWSFESLF